MSIANYLLSWYQKNSRDLPWRKTQDPYVIWLSEIILQQTRVEQGMPYFYRFLEELPTVKDFAESDSQTILRLWQGLGYYSRARNMHKAAKLVMQKYGGVFPCRYDELIELPGVGDYTASAISSFSSNEQRAVLDGNVFRFLSRYFGIYTPINSSQGKKEFSALASSLISSEQPGLYNQAIMDFGSLVCKPKSPLCISCELHGDCKAFQQELISELPVKTKAKASRNRYFNYFILEHSGEFVLTKRPEGDVWADLYEFPLIQSDHMLAIDELYALSEFQAIFPEGVTLEQIGPEVKHVLSHQNIFARFYRVHFQGSKIEKNPQWNYYNSDKMDKLAKHKLIFTFIKKYLVD